MEIIETNIFPDVFPDFFLRQMYFEINIFQHNTSLLEKKKKKHCPRKKNIVTGKVLLALICRKTI